MIVASLRSRRVLFFFDAGQRILRGVIRPDYRYVKAGVLYLKLVPDDEKQTNRFRPLNPEREQQER